MIKKILACICVTGMLIQNGYAQQRDVSQRFTRWSAEIGAGAPVLFASIPSKFTMFGTLGVRYSLSKEISLQGAIQYGAFRGEQTPPSPYVNPSKTETNFYSFRNNFIQYSANIQINLEPLLKLRRFMPRLNPYLLAGMGRIQSEIETERLVPDNTKKTFIIPERSYYTQYYGLVFRYYLNPQLDFVVSAIYHTTQSPVIDGIPTTNLEDFDSYIMPSLCINYKIGAKKRSVEHVDWYNVKSKKKIIDPDYPGEKPLAEKAKDDSIAKANQALVAENEALKRKNDSLAVINSQLAKENEALKAAGAAELAQKNTKDSIDAIQAKSQKGKQGLTDGITAPPHKYNVVVGCYTSKRYAYIYRDRIRAKGYSANIYRTGQDSRMLRVTILSTEDRAEAQRLVNQARKTIDPGSWLHIYNKP